MSETKGANMQEAQTLTEEEHITPAGYAKIFTILTLITLVEVVIYYIESWRPAFLPVFLLLSAAKFIIVVMFFMHLRFDNRLFSWMLVGGFTLATCIIIALLGLFGIIGG